MKTNYSKISVIALLLVSIANVVSACPVCERRQPEVLRGITHGAGPDNNGDYIIVGVIAVVVLITLYFSVKWLVRPGEGTSDHIKRSVLDFD
jgi:hypothetical protein